MEKKIQKNKKKTSAQLFRNWLGFFCLCFSFILGTFLILIIEEHLFIGVCLISLSSYLVGIGDTLGWWVNG